MTQLIFSKIPIRASYGVTCDFDIRFSFAIVIEVSYVISWYIRPHFSSTWLHLVLICPITTPKAIVSRLPRKTTFIAIVPNIKSQKVYTSWK